MWVLVKGYIPEYYDAADGAAIEVTEELVLTLAHRMMVTKKVFEDQFFGTKWWDYTPYFVPFGGPETFDLDMTEEDFEHQLESNYYVRLPDSFDVQTADYAPMRPCTLTVCASSNGKGDIIGGFYWTGTDKYIGNTGRCETYELHEDTLKEWAELLGINFCSGCGCKLDKGYNLCTECSSEA